MSASLRVRAVVAVVASLVAAVAVTLTPATPADAAGKVGSAKAKAEALRRQVSDLQRQIAVAIANYDTVYAALGSVVTARMQAEAALAEANTVLAEGGARSSSRIRALYQGGGDVALFASVLDSADLHDAQARWANVSALVAEEVRSVDTAEAAVRAAAAAQQELRAASARQVKLEREAQQQAADVESLLNQTQQLLAAADADVRRLVEEERLAAERAAQAAFLASMSALSGSPYQPDTSLKYACPVGTIRSFVDTWGAPRSGGRRHQGTDVFAPRGTPAYAVADGVIDRWSTNALGGTTLYLRTDRGDQFYYAHNDRNIAPAGTRVKAGDVIATVGNTGNAATTPSHIHFEVHPGGGAPVNPYPFLKGICG